VLKKIGVISGWLGIVIVIPLWLEPSLAQVEGHREIKDSTETKLQRRNRQKLRSNQLRIKTKQEFFLNRSAKVLLAQEEENNVLTQITGVSLNSTDDELQVILETPSGQRLQPSIFPEGNNLIIDISAATLALPDGQNFIANNPTTGITQVTVTSSSSNSIRVVITGDKNVPNAEVIPSQQNLVLSITSKEVTTEQAPEEELEILVTGEKEDDDNYSVPDATTATKTDTPLRDVPQSIQVIPRQIIEDQEITRISDAVRNVSGVSVERSYADNTDVYRIRGFVNPDSLRNGFFVQDPSINTTNIERVEVLKGPGSVLYGQFEPGGIVNYVTKKPLDKPYYSAEFTAGNYDFYNPSIDFSGPLNEDKTLLYRLNASYLDSGNFVDFVEQQQFAIATALTYKISNTTTLDFEYEYIDENRTFYDGLPPDSASFKVPISRFLGEPSDDDYTSSSNNINLSLNHRFSDNLKLRSNFGAQIGTFKSSLFRINDLLEDGRSVFRYYQEDDNVEIENYSLQTDLIGKFNTGSIKHQLLFGLDLSRSVYADDFYSNFSDSNLPPIDLFDPVYGTVSRPDRSELTFEPFRNERDTIGIYLQDQVTLLPNLKMLLGGRYDFIDRKNTELDTEENLSDEAFSPRVGIVYQPIEPISIYTSYTRSFKTSTDRTAGGSLFPPERGTQYEVGIKADLNNKLSATLAAYEIAKTNVATTDPENPDFSIAAGEVTSRGIELDLSSEIVSGWNVIASLFVNDAFVSKDNELPEGDTLVNAPGVGASLWTTYEIQTGDWKGLGFGGGLFYVGDREAELPNDLVIPSYVRADASIFYKRDNWRLGLNFKNLTDTKYYESQGFYLLPGAPFTVLGSVHHESRYWKKR
jgi:iron complex outermembrane recepter protein